MSLEIEKRFRQINITNIKKIMKQNGFKKQGGFLFKILTYKGLNDNQVIRIRDEGFRTTFTIKDLSHKPFEKEYEVNISDFDMMRLMLEQLNLEIKYGLNKFREIYKSKNGKNEVIFDYFPGLPPYMEIESKTEKDLNETMKLFGVKDEPKFTGSDLYLEHYGIPIYKPDGKDEGLNFENAEKRLTKQIKKNKSVFLTLLKEQKKKLLKKGIKAKKI